MDELTNSSQMRFSTSTDDDGTVVVRLSGELDCTNADKLRQAVEHLIGLQPPRLIFDLGELFFVDSSGLSVMVLAANEVEDVAVRNASPIVRRVLDATGLATVLHPS